MVKSLVPHEKFAGTVPQRIQQFTNREFVLRRRDDVEVEAGSSRPSKSAVKENIHLAHALIEEDW